jgi:3-methyladenine DNA glycosylase AlkD
MFDLIRCNLGSKEFFINKAIGWILREYSKTDAQVVTDFVKKTDLTPLSKREALKWLVEHPTT